MTMMAMKMMAMMQLSVQKLLSLQPLLKGKTKR
jgi:hypothetical protein